MAVKTEIQRKSEKHPISKQVLKLRVNGSFIVKDNSERKFALDAARYFGLKVMSRRLGGTFKIFRIG